MGKKIELDAVIGTLYEAALTPAAWCAALTGMADAFEARSVSLMRIRLDDGAIVAVHQVGHEAASQDAYTRYFHSLDPTLEAAETVPVGHWHLGPDLLDPLRPAQAEYVHDYCRPHDIRWVAGAKLVDKAGFRTILSVQRGYGAEPFDQRSRAWFDRLESHLVRALSISQELSSLRRAVADQAAALDALPYAAIVLDAKLHIRHANAVALRLLLESDVLHARHGRLRLGSAQQNDQLTQAVDRACRQQGAVGTEMQCRGARRWLHAQVVPVTPAQIKSGMQDDPLALLILGEPVRQRFDPGALAQRFDLTPAEASLLAALAAGTTVAEWSAQRGIRVATVRSQLHALFQKTGCASQAALVAAARALPPAMAIR